jgi:hypothetical protein
MFFNVAYQALGGLVRLIDGSQRVKIGVFTIFASIALAASEKMHRSHVNGEVKEWAKPGANRRSLVLRFSVLSHLFHRFSRKRSNCFLKDLQGQAK